MILFYTIVMRSNQNYSRGQYFTQLKLYIYIIIIIIIIIMEYKYVKLYVAKVGYGGWEIYISFWFTLNQCYKNG